MAEAHGLVSRIHRKKPGGRPMPANVRRGNTTWSRIRILVEHVFAHQKCPEGGLCIRTIGLERANTKVGLCNINYNMQRCMFHERRRRPTG